MDGPSTVTEPKEKKMSASLASAGAPVRGRRPGLLSRLLAVHAVWRERRALADLDDRALRDIGVTRGAARDEAARPIWELPGHRGIG
ncbi:DUF1127 domain-containing protein [Tranquillimonas rosea]|uniref:DUF1127 domain-containing protein n=1 Tax=Tranquillimonas rosea TaxID=641238 RepID=UPI003BAAD1A6